MNVRIIVNPIAGRGRGRRAGRALAEALERRGAKVDLRETTAAGDGRRLAAEAGRFDALLAVGGDGSFHEMLNGLPEPGAVPVGQYPLGTANVLAKELRLPRDPGRLAALVAAGRTRTLDLGIAGESRRFLLVASAGFDAWILETLHRDRRGPIFMAHYPMIGARFLFTYRGWNLRVRVDGKVAAEGVTQFVVSNVACFGGPLQITPSARPDDGRLDVFCLRGHGKRDVVRFVAAAFLRRTERMGGAVFARGTEVEVESLGAPCPVELDGEPYGATPARFRLLPSAVRVFAP